MLRRPRSAIDRSCVIVLVHGGFWRWPVNRWVTSLLARDAARRGFTVFNVEYRRLGRFGGGGGWPETFDDVADAVTVVAERLDDSRIVLVGHSAGGHLALVTAARHAARVVGVVAMSAPTNLRALSENGSEPVDALVADAPAADRWRLTSPIEMVPLGVPTLCVHGDADTTVRPDSSTDYVRAAVSADDEAELVLVPGETHRSALLPSSGIWRAALAAIDRWVTPDDAVSSPDQCLTMGGG